MITVAAPVAMTLLAPAAKATLFAAMLRATPDNMRGRVTNTVTQRAVRRVQPRLLLAAAHSGAGQYFNGSLLYQVAW
jgi:hypothetical protein